MKPIINPLWIYLIDVFDSIKSLSDSIFIVAIAALIIASFKYYMEYDDGCLSKELERSLKKVIKKSVIILIISSVITVAIPCKEIMYTMMTLEQVTPDNIKVVGEAGENIIEYIIEKIDQVVNDKDSDGKGE